MALCGVKSATAIELQAHGSEIDCINDGGQRPLRFRQISIKSVSQYPARLKLRTAAPLRPGIAIGRAA
jgi:hypothetical protein